MPRGRLVKIIVAVWAVATPATLVFSLLLYSDLHNHPYGSVLGASTHEAELFSAPPPLLNDVSQSFAEGDARSLLVERFLHVYHSPLQGNGETIVQMADKYHIDWRLVPAIAFQESSLGQVMPRGSYNAWGWAIFTGQNSGANFNNWSDAIEKVSRGLSRNYYSQGLKTPRQIMRLYAPDSDGSWASSVQGAMEEIATGT